MCNYFGLYFTPNLYSKSCRPLDRGTGKADAAKSKVPRALPESDLRDKEGALMITDILVRQPA